MNLLAKLFYQVSCLWWKIARPLTVGVRVLLIRDGAVLLVRHTYQDAWYLPGGGVKRGETLPDAIRREAMEEVGAALGPLELLGLYSNFYEHKSDHIAVFVCDGFSLAHEADCPVGRDDLEPRGQSSGEIARWGFFTPDALPEGTSPGTRRRVAEYLEGGMPYLGSW